ncbi:MAG: hypothetical protein EZS28_046862, partial [Streblomastix strix]
MGILYIPYQTFSYLDQKQLQYKKFILISDDRIRAFQAEKDRQFELNEAIKQQKKDEEAKKLAKVLDEITKEKLFREELEMLSEELDLEEEERKQRDKDKAAAEKAVRTKIEVQEAEVEWKRLKQEQKQREFEGDQKEKQEIM